MTIQECYRALEGDYDEILNRFRREAMITKFASKFPRDKSFQELEENLSKGQEDEAFRAAHTLKGVAQNLSFTKLGLSSSKITEMLRAGNMAEAKEYFATVKADYEQTVEAISQLDH